MRLSPVPPSIFTLFVLLAGQAQGFQRAGAGVLEVLTALQRKSDSRGEDGDNMWHD